MRIIALGGGGGGLPFFPQGKIQKNFFFGGGGGGGGGGWWYPQNPFKEIPAKIGIFGRKTLFLALFGPFCGENSRLFFVKGWRGDTPQFC